MSSYSSVTFYEDCQKDNIDNIIKNIKLVKQMNKSHILEGFYHACKENNFGLVKWFDENFSIDYNYRNGIFLSTACINSNSELVDWLLEKVTAENIQFFTYACRGGNIEIAKKTLKYFNSPKINSRLYYSKSNEEHIEKMLYICANKGHVDIFRWLIDEVKINISQDIINNCFMIAKNENSSSRPGFVFPFYISVHKYILPSQALIINYLKTKVTIDTQVTDKINELDKMINEFKKMINEIEKTKSILESP